MRPKRKYLTGDTAAGASNKSPPGNFPCGTEQARTPVASEWFRKTRGVLMGLVWSIARELPVAGAVLVLVGLVG
jgi:hypothetical protein